MAVLCRRTAILFGTLAGLCAVSRVQAEPSANDWISGQIVKIDYEAGKITLQHAPIPYLHLSQGTTTFRYIESKWLIGRSAGDRVLFRADRIDLTLRMTALIYVRG